MLQVDNISDTCRQILCLYLIIFGQAEYFYFIQLTSRWFLDHSSHFHLNSLKRKAEHSSMVISDGMIYYHQKIAGRLKGKRKYFTYILKKGLEQSNFSSTLKRAWNYWRVWNVYLVINKAFDIALMKFYLQILVKLAWLKTESHCLKKKKSLRRLLPKGYEK